MKSRFSYWTCQGLGWGGYSAMGMTMAAQQVGWSAGTVVGYLLFAIYSIALTDLLRREMRRRGWLDLAAWLMVPRLALAVAIISGIQTLLVGAVDIAFQRMASQFFLHPGFMGAMWFGVFGADVAWVLCYVGLTSKRRYREKEVAMQLALREAELRALEAQVNPHFLFNCLNSIRALVVENPVQAQDMITRFAAILRYNLQRDLNHTAPLAGELEVVNDYLALESIRLEDRLRVVIAVDAGAAECRFPTMVLQTLVENAVKHGIAPMPAGGEVQIRGALHDGSLVVQVENSGQLAAARSGRNWDWPMRASGCAFCTADAPAWNWRMAAAAWSPPCGFRGRDESAVDRR